MFIMLMNAFTAWFFALIPVYFIVVRNAIPAYYVWVLMDFYGLMNAVCFYIRFKFLNIATKNKI